MFNGKNSMISDINMANNNRTPFITERDKILTKL